MNIVSQRKPGSSSPSVSKVSTHPNCVDWFTRRTFHHSRQSSCAKIGGVLVIMHLATINIRVKAIVEPQSGNSIYKWVQFHFFDSSGA
jgi:hypothetical protein